jgi:hypothetical protein
MEHFRCPKCKSFKVRLCKWSPNDSKDVKSINCLCEDCNCLFERNYIKRFDDGEDLYIGSKIIGELT